MRSLEYDVLDVFADKAFAGNPLAVVHGAEGLTTAQLQAVAREFNLSETAFPVLPAEQDAADGVDYRVRIFTPLTELPFAGHPSIGTAWLLAQRGELAPGRVVQRSRGGDAALDVASDGGPVTLHGLAPHVGAVLDDDVVLPAVGLGRGDLVGLPTVRAGAGLDFAFVTVRPGSTARAHPKVDLLRAMRVSGAAIGGVVVVGWHEGLTRVRVFAHDIGVAEDPATGSAALGLGAVLVHHELLPGDGESDFEVSQGVEVGRPSRLLCHVTARGGVAVATSVSGAVVPVATGTMRVPA